MTATSEIKLFPSGDASNAPDAGPQVKHDIRTTINYYDDPEDGNPPTPVYVGR